MKFPPIMLQGCSSNAGKTTLVAGLCRLLANKGLKVAPFKSQNMALNSFATIHGEEIARATAVQAKGAKQTPLVHMNPILLKPKSDQISQLIVHGKVVQDVNARQYFSENAKFSQLQKLKLQAIYQSFEFLKENFDCVVIEGAGSCAEPNLRAIDIVNMGLARLLKAHVYLITDINKGGSFADILGTLRILELTEPEDIPLIKGIILNKFRGDPDILQPAIDFVTKETNIPIIGVIPYLNNLSFEEEDLPKQYACKNPEIDIAIIYLPHISNTSDFDILAAEENVHVRYVKSRGTLGLPDLILIPGTKNTISDLLYLRRIGLEQAIQSLSSSTPICGICGGYEMLGNQLRDPEKIESPNGTISGMRFFDFDVIFQQDKIVSQRTYQPTSGHLFSSVGIITGYEIRCGRVTNHNYKPLFEHHGMNEGIIDSEKMIFGTFIHDIFKNTIFTRTLINTLRAKKGLSPLSGPHPSLEDQSESSYELLANILEKHCNWNTTFNL